MTNHWADMQHCKTILVEGSNVAENHPMAFKWILPLPWDERSGSEAVRDTVY
jgi:anaerobic selenocysteine-containing dehydrogenase